MTSTRKSAHVAHSGRNRKPRPLAARAKSNRHAVMMPPNAQNGRPFQRSRSVHTEARTFGKPSLNTVRLPTGLPFGFSETPGGHIRPCTYLLGSRAISSVPSVNRRLVATSGHACFASSPIWPKRSRIWKLSLITSGASGASLFDSLQGGAMKTCFERKKC